MANLARSRILLAAAVVLSASLAPLAAFSHAAVGDKLEPRELDTLDGARAPYLGDAAVNVFVFLRPDQEHTREVLPGLVALEEEMAEKDVHFVAIVSDRFSADEVRAMAADSGLSMPVLVDGGDALYGELGAALHPVLGIADQDHVLVAYQPFRKLNFAELVRARVRHQLGEISDEELARVEEPPKTEVAGRDDTAERHLKMARMLIVAGKLEKAMESAEKSLEIAPELAAAHALVGSILAAQGDCPAALEAFARALELDPEEPTATQGKAACEGG